MLAQAQECFFEKVQRLPHNQECSCLCLTVDVVHRLLKIT
jgi:hypothetical protein